MSVLCQTLLVLLLAFITQLHFDAWEADLFRDRLRYHYDGEHSLPPYPSSLSIENDALSDRLFPTFAEAYRVGQEQQWLPSISLIESALEAEEDALVAELAAHDPSTRRGIMTPWLKVPATRETTEQIRSRGIDTRPRVASALPDYRLYALVSTVDAAWDYDRANNFLQQSYRDHLTETFRAALPAVLPAAVAYDYSNWQLRPMGMWSWPWEYAGMKWLGISARCHQNPAPEVCLHASH